MNFFHEMVHQSCGPMLNSCAPPIQQLLGTCISSSNLLLWKITWIVVALILAECCEGCPSTQNLNQRWTPEQHTWEKSPGFQQHPLVISFGKRLQKTNWKDPPFFHGKFQDFNRHGFNSYVINYQRLSSRDQSSNHPKPTSRNRRPNRPKSTP